MKKIFLLCAFVFAIAGMASAQVSAIPKDGQAPQFKFEEELHDFGTLPEGPLAEYVFVFKNVGSVPIMVTRASGSGDPTAVDWSRVPVLPGKKGKLKVVRITQGRVVPFDKKIFVQFESNVPGQTRQFKDYELRIKGNVVKPDTPLPAGNPIMQPGTDSERQIKRPKFKFEEEVHDFGTLEAGPPAKWKFWFKNVGDAPLLITHAGTGDGGSYASGWSEEPIMPGKKGFVEFTQDTSGGRTQFERNIYIGSNALVPETYGDRYILTAKGKIKPLK